MATNPQEIISKVQTLPISVQEQIVKTLQKNLGHRAASSTPNEDEIEEILLAKGLISEIPERSEDPEEETYEPIYIEGESLSATILEERE